MKPAFDITSENMDSALLKPCTLLLELNERQLTCAWVNKNSHQLLRLKQYHFEMGDEDAATLLQDLVESDDHLQQEIREAVVIYNYGDTNLLPDPYFSIELSKPLAELVTGNAHKGLVLSEKIFGRDMYTIYRIPREIHTLLQRKFSAGKYWHFYSLLLYSTAENKTDKDIYFRLYFYPDKFVVAVFKGNEPQLLQSYSYQVPEDVSYYLLNICKQFSIDPATVQLYLSGLIDADSALYSEVYRYFLTIDWDASGTTAWKNDKLADYPRIIFHPCFKWHYAYNWRRIGGKADQSSGKYAPYQTHNGYRKEGLFNILGNNLEFGSLKTLDLFGGTGSISYELASRGAKDLTIVEKDNAMYEFIKKNVALLNLENFKVIKTDVFRFVDQCTDKFDFIFAGPPYALTNIDDLPKIIVEKKLLNPGGWFVLEHTPRNDYTLYPQFVSARNYGTTIFSIFVNKL